MTRVQFLAGAEIFLFAAISRTAQVQIASYSVITESRAAGM